MSIFDYVEDLEFDSTIITATIPEGVNLPELGVVIEQCGIESRVIGVDEEARTVDFHIKKSLSKEEIIDAMREKLNDGIDEISHLLYLWDNKDKPSSLILWSDVPDKLKSPYGYLASKVIKILSNTGLCFVDPEDFLED